MRPLAAVTLILLGSSVAITVSLMAVVVVVLVLGDEYPRLAREFRPLLTSLAIFTAMTAVSALSFYGILKTHRLRYCAQAAMWLGLFLTGWFYWP